MTYATGSVDDTWSIGACSFLQFWRLLPKEKNSL
jgi:hypothetical protein